MVRRLSRLAPDMILNEPIRYARTMRGLEAGEWIRLATQVVGLESGSKVVVEFGIDG